MGKKNKQAKEEKPSLDYTDEIKRLNRVSGQVEGIKKMLSENRALDDVLTQCKAVHSALRSVEERLLANHLDDAIRSIVKADKKKGREQGINALLELYRPV